MNANSAQFAASNDLALVHSSKKGNVAAFEQLVKRYGRRLIRIAPTLFMQLVYMRGSWKNRTALRHSYLPAPRISLLSPCATAGYTAPLRRRRSRGNSERSTHNPAATAAAQVTDTSAS